MDNQNQILRARGLRAAPFGYRETPLSGPLSQSTVNGRRQMLSKKVELYKAHLIIDTMSKIKPTFTELCGAEKPDSRSMTAITREATPKKGK